MKIELVTDGKLWAIRRKSLFKIEYGYFDTSGFSWVTSFYDNSWVTKDVAELWYKRLNV